MAPKQVYRVMIRTKSKSGWGTWHGEGVSKTKTKAKQYAERQKKNSNRPMQYRIVPVSSKGWDYNNYETLPRW